MTGLRFIVVSVVIACMLVPVYAIDAESLDDPVLHTRYMHIISELRCMVCQNQSIMDSDATLAKDLRRQVRNLLLEGRSDQEIMMYMVDRYGDYVRYRPPLKWSTALGWIGPGLIALLGLWLFAVTLRRHVVASDATDTESSE